MALVVLFLVLLYSVVVAGDISLTATNNVDGTLTVGYTSSGGGGLPPAVIALKLQDCNAPIQEVATGDNPFDLIRFLDPNSGQVESFGLMNALPAGGTDTDTVINLVTLNFGSGPVYGTLVPNIELGGIVDMTGGACPITCRWTLW